MHSAENVRDTTLDDEIYNVHNIEQCIDMMFIVVTVLCNQPLSLRTSVTTSHVACAVTEFQ